ncbi:YigZ family protein [bacterium SCSIO 12741]|nr:YigZ family protein [bacterium SCSIO 12741]
MSDDREFLTLEKPTEGLFKDRGSKHFSFAYPVSTLEEIKAHLQRLRDEHPTANHVCYGYRLTGQSIIEYASDDGEPSNSAGAPILGQLKSMELENVLVAVVRYFGGTKLGVPGLINAYRTAAREALDAGKMIRKQPTVVLELRFTYDQSGEVDRTLRQLNLVPIHKEYTETCLLRVELKKLDQDSILRKFERITDLEWTLNAP